MDMLKLALVLTLLAALLVIVADEVRVGKTAFSIAESKAEAAQKSLARHGLFELSGTTTKMPAATCYSLIRYNGSELSSVECDICHTSDTLGECLKEHMTQDVNVTVMKDQTGMYEVRISAP